jgi:RNA polymerase sigma-70 factor (ECF subfamily)
MPEPIPFDELFAQHRDGIYRFCLLQLRDPAIAEDLAADAFAAALAAYDRVRPDPDGVKVWLYTIARNRISSYRSKSWRWAKLLRSMVQNTASSDIESDAGVRDELRIVLRAMQRLSPRDQRLIALRTGTGLSFREVGELMGMSEKTATVATHRALERLRKAAAGEES